MRLLTGIAAAALAGLAAAGSQEAAEVHLFKSSSSSSQSKSSSSASPRIPKEIARHIFLQRTSQDRYGSPLRDIPNTIDEETAISYINKYGKRQSSIFEVPEASYEPKQLVIILEGYNTEKAGQLKQALAGSQDAFLVSNPPSAKANNRLMADFKAAGVGNKQGCKIQAAVNPSEKSCWEGDSSVVRYDLQKTPILDVSTAIDNLARLASSEELEALVLLLPESSRSSSLGSWASSSAHNTLSSDLRRRETEFVLTDEAVSAPESTHAAEAFWEANRQDKGAKTPIPACFPSANSCETRTSNCSGGHGVCLNRYKDQPDHKPCFACHCMSTVVRDGTEPGAVGEKTTRWAGNMCQKKDVSVPFWLLTGFTITIIGAISFAISLLYSVGDEQLPGVIGAGVSRSK